MRTAGWVIKQDNRLVERLDKYGAFNYTSKRSAAVVFESLQGAKIALATRNKHFIDCGECKIYRLTRHKTKKVFVLQSTITDYYFNGSQWGPDPANAAEYTTEDAAKAAPPTSNAFKVVARTKRA